MEEESAKVTPRNRRGEKVIYCEDFTPGRRRGEMVIYCETEEIGDDGHSTPNQNSSTKTTTPTTQGEGSRGSGESFLGSTTPRSSRKEELMFGYDWGKTGANNHSSSSSTPNNHCPSTTKTTTPPTTAEGRGGPEGYPSTPSRKGDKVFRVVDLSALPLEQHENDQTTTSGGGGGGSSSLKKMGCDGTTTTTVEEDEETRPDTETPMVTLVDVFPRNDSNMSPEGGGDYKERYPNRKRHESGFYSEEQGQQLVQSSGDARGGEGSDGQERYPSRKQENNCNSEQGQQLVQSIGSSSCKKRKTHPTVGEVELIFLTIMAERGLTEEISNKELCKLSGFSSPGVHKFIEAKKILTTKGFLEETWKKQSKFYRLTASGRKAAAANNGTEEEGHADSEQDKDGAIQNDCSMTTTTTAAATGAGVGETYPNRRGEKVEYCEEVANVIDSVLSSPGSASIKSTVGGAGDDDEAHPSQKRQQVGFYSKEQELVQRSSSGDSSCKMKTTRTRVEELEVMILTKISESCGLAEEISNQELLRLCGIPPDGHKNRFVEAKQRLTTKGFLEETSKKQSKFYSLTELGRKAAAAHSRKGEKVEYCEEGVAVVDKAVNSPSKASINSAAEGGGGDAAAAAAAAAADDDQEGRCPSRRRQQAIFYSEEQGQQIAQSISADSSCKKRTRRVEELELIILTKMAEPGLVEDISNKELCKLCGLSYNRSHKFIEAKNILTTKGFLETTKKKTAKFYRLTEAGLKAAATINATNSKEGYANLEQDNNDDAIHIHFTDTTEGRGDEEERCPSQKRRHAGFYHDEQVNNKSRAAAVTSAGEVELIMLTKITEHGRLAEEFSNKEIYELCGWRYPHSGSRYKLFVKAKEMLTTKGFLETTSISPMLYRLTKAGRKAAAAAAANNATSEEGYADSEQDNEDTAMHNHSTNTTAGVGDEERYPSTNRKGGYCEEVVTHAVTKDIGCGDNDGLVANNPTDKAGVGDERHPSTNRKVEKIDSYEEVVTDTEMKDISDGYSDSDDCVARIPRNPPTNTITTGGEDERYPKRKRQEVNYCEEVVANTETKGGGSVASIQPTNTTGGDERYPSRKRQKVDMFSKDLALQAQQLTYRSPKKGQHNNTRKRTTPKAKPNKGTETRKAKNITPSDAENTGKWNPKEHKIYLKAIEMYGNDWQSVAAMVGTRTPDQVAHHYDNCRDVNTWETEQRILAGIAKSVSKNGVKEFSMDQLVKFSGYQWPTNKMFSKSKQALEAKGFLESPEVKCKGWTYRITAAGLKAAQGIGPLPEKKKQAPRLKSAKVSDDEDDDVPLAELATKKRPIIKLEDVKPPVASSIEKLGDPNMGMCLVHPPSEEHIAVTLLKQIHEELRDPQIKKQFQNWIKKHQEDSTGKKKESCRSIQGGRIEIFLDATGKSSEAFDKIIGKKLPRNAKQIVLDYARHQANQDPRLKEGYKYENFSLLVSLNRSPAQAPHLDLVHPNYQFGVSLSDKTSGTLFVENQVNPVKTVEDLEKLWNQNPSPGDDPTEGMPPNIKKVFQEDDGAKQLLSYFGDTLPPEDMLQRSMTSRNRLPAGTLCSLPGSVVHAGPASLGMRAILFFSGTPEDPSKVDPYLPDSQYNGVTLMGHFVSILWRQDTIVTNERLYLLRRLVQYIEGTSAKEVFALFGDGCLKDFVKAILRKDYGDSSSKEDFIQKESLRVEMSYGNDPFSVTKAKVDVEKMRCVSCEDLFTVWEGKELPILVYRMNMNRKIVIRYITPGKESECPDEYEGHRDEDDLKLIWDEGKSAGRFDGSNGKILDTDGDVIEIYKGSKTGQEWPSRYLDR